MTDSEIILCSGIKMDKNYENVLSYNEEQMVSLCRSNAIYTGNNYKIVGVRENIINVSARYEDCIYANYMAFKNKKYGNKWFFAWVTDVKLLNPATTEITFQIDVFSTWYSRFNVGQGFIEREHVDDDTIGKHTLPEGLETGEYITQINSNTEVSPYLSEIYYLSDLVIVAGVTDLGLTYAIPLNAQDNTYNGVYSGLRYLAFKNTRDLEKYIKNCQQNLSSDNIATLFVVPSSLTGLSSADWITTTVGGDIHYSFEFAFVPTSNTGVLLGDGSYPKPDHLDSDYVPVNKKLFTFPYCFLNVTNNSGVVKDYHYELFNDSLCYFKVRGAIGVGCSIKMFPLDYDMKGTGTSTIQNRLHSIDAGKLPTCGWLNDAYTNWLTSQAVNIPLNLTKDILQIGGGFATGQLGGVASGYTGIVGQMASIYEHSLQPASAKGGLNQGDFNFAYRDTFNFYPMSIKKENAIIIDAYFSRFGYQVNEVKTPNLNSRQQFNFIKVGGMDEIISGNIPATALEEINSIFRKGVTIFHNYNNIGNYTISNPIVND